MSVQIISLFSVFILLGLSTAFGMRQIKTLIQIREARHEMGEGSASRIRRQSKWFGLALWVAGVWVLALVIGYFFAHPPQKRDPTAPLEVIRVPEPRR